ncbi:MAG TPA: hypothetical protein VMR62_18890 [Bryobacteraceae bacterium]|jgi:hypothetical protein|nr:hypothetical protein [Bryobacteraceae bacterium]
MKKLGALMIPALVLWAASGVRADVTIRYQTEFKPAAALQPLMEQIMKSAQAASGVSVSMKGNKGYSTAGKWTEIFDFASGEVTLLDPEHKTFATLPLAQLGDKMAGAIPQVNAQQAEAAQQAMASIKSYVASRMTGNTAEIQGVQAEERELTLTMDLPIMNQTMNQMMNQSGPGMKMVMHIWTAKKEEALRVPAIRELTGYYAWQKYVLNPAGMMQKMAGKVPGLSESVGPLLEEIFKNQSVILRSQMEMYMPFLATVAKQMAAKDQPPMDIDPDAPVMVMTQEVAELSSAPVDASLFEIPKDYTAASADDMVKDLLKAQNPAMPIAPKTGAPN